MMASNVIHEGVKYFKTLYLNEDTVASFHEGLDFSTTGDEVDVILKPCIEDEKVNMAAPSGLEGVFSPSHIRFEGY